MKTKKMLQNLLKKGGLTAREAASIMAYDLVSWCSGEGARLSESEMEQVKESILIKEMPLYNRYLDLLEYAKFTTVVRYHQTQLSLALAFSGVADLVNGFLIDHQMDIRDYRAPERGAGVGILLPPEEYLRQISSGLLTLRNMGTTLKALEHILAQLSECFRGAEFLKIAKRAMYSVHRGQAYLAGYTFTKAMLRINPGLVREISQKADLTIDPWLSDPEGALRDIFIEEDPGEGSPFSEAIRLSPDPEALEQYESEADRAMGSSVWRDP